MKRWLLDTDENTWTPIIVCPHCGSTWSPVIMHLFTMCPICNKRVRQPKKDYWESMEEGEVE